MHSNKENKMPTLENKIYEVISKMQMGTFSTITGEGKPWSRYVMLWGDEDLTMYLFSRYSARKVDQVKNNTDVHINIGSSGMEKMTPYIQLAGTASVITDPEIKKKYWNESMTKMYKGPEDPDLALIKVKPERIEYNDFKSMSGPEIWEK